MHNYDHVGKEHDSIGHARTWAIQSGSITVKSPRHGWTDTFDQDGMWNKQGRARKRHAGGGTRSGS